MLRNIFRFRKKFAAKALQQRLISILLKPRESVQVGEYYGPAPRSSMLNPKGNRSDVSPTTA